MAVSNDPALRRQRLQTLGHEIRDGLRAQYRAGLRLKEIRDDGLYQEDGFESFKAFVKAEFEWSKGEADRLIRMAECAEVIRNLDAEPSDRSE